MSQKFNKVVTLLKELFQLDQPDLDFGLYRIMHAKSGEITQFLETDLLPQVQAAFGEYKTADKAELEKELAKVIAGVEAAGMNADDAPKVKELRAKIADDAVDVAALESEVYDHLYSFFRRYYHEGDFLSKRVYKQGVYAIPYEGEEVKLHWANKDQYYIKTSEYLRDYAFRLRAEDDANPMRLHFKLVDASEGEHGNVKATEGKDRVFILAPAGESGHDFLSIENDELSIAFEYRPASLDDWTEETKAAATAAAKKKPPVQSVLLAQAAKAILEVAHADYREWIVELNRKHVKTDGEQADYSRLEAHLRRYSARNTFDYFIHKDLGGFLKRELDFYIKNEVMHLDDIENETVARAEQYLSKIKVIRKIAGKLIAFLAQLEDFQKKLWLKKKFVVETNYCITLDRIPEEFYPEIASNDAQREEWVKLFAIDEIEASTVSPAYSAPLTQEFLKANQNLILDTNFFDRVFKEKLVNQIEHVDSSSGGLLVHSENFQAVRFLEKRFQNKYQCIYIDPPYNAQSSEIPYKNTFKHSSWMSLMANRIAASRPLLSEDSIYITAIDEIENLRLGYIFEEEFPNKEDAIVSIVHNPTGQQGKNFSYTHEFAHFLIPRNKDCIGLEDREDETREAKPDIRPLRNVSSGQNHLRESAANCFYPIYVKDGKIAGFGDVCSDDFHPGDINLVKEDGTVEIYPIDPSGIESKWVFERGTVEGILNELTPKLNDQTGEWDIIRKKSKFRYKSLWTDKRYSANSWGSVVLNNIIPNSPFKYPKSLYNVQDCVDAGLGNSPEGSILDYFAGSGTTGHAVINLNRMDGGSRFYTLVEMGNYFDEVTKPRMQKVAYAPDWKSGKPNSRDKSISHCFKYIRLESYEDALNNLEPRRDGTQQDLLAAAASQGEDGLKEQYMLRYMLDVETRESPSLLNIQAFSDPTAYKLKVKRPGSDESKEVNVDLLETFNYLIGLTVEHIAAPQVFSAEFERDAEQRLKLNGRLKQDAEGPYWFRTVTGTTPDGQKTLVIWRKLTGTPEEDNLVLDEWFTRQGYSTRDSEFQLIYVNGDCTLENLKTAEDTWKVRLLEEDFHRLMFDTEGL